MPGLERVLMAKIVVTVFAWALPLLLLPAEMFVLLGFPLPEPPVFLRLLGTAYAALVVGYALGLGRARRNAYPAEAVYVGIASNGGAAVVLAIAALSGSWSAWGSLAKVYMWFSLFAVTAIALGLILIHARYKQAGLPDESNP